MRKERIAGIKVRGVMGMGEVCDPKVKWKVLGTEGLEQVNVACLIKLIL